MNNFTSTASLYIFPLIVIIAQCNCLILMRITALVWHSGIASVSINVVTLRLARLVPGYG